MRDFDTLLKESSEAHGHLCPGQAVGVRMALLGCRLIGLDDPKSHDQIKKLIVYVEMDRCTGDAIAHVTGAKLGRRSLKFMDYGIMAASFVNLETVKAFRVISTEEARDLAHYYAPEIFGRYEQQLKAYKRMPDSVLFRVQEVQVPLSEFDLPGPTRRKVLCNRCGQTVRDYREVVENGDTLCKPCAHGAYFKNPQEITWPEMNWAPVSSKQQAVSSRQQAVRTAESRSSSTRSSVGGAFQWRSYDSNDFKDHRRHDLKKETSGAEDHKAEGCGGEQAGA